MKWCGFIKRKISVCNAFFFFLPIGDCVTIRNYTQANEMQILVNTFVFEITRTIIYLVFCLKIEIMYVSKIMLAPGAEIPCCGPGLTT